MSYGKTDDGKTMRSQNDVIKNYLITTGFSLSQQDCIKLWGFTRLSARMYDIRDSIERNNEPYVVCTKMVNGTNRFGMPCKWKEYWIQKK